LPPGPFASQNVPNFGNWLLGTGCDPDAWICASCSCIEVTPNCARLWAAKAMDNTTATIVPCVMDFMLFGFLWLVLGLWFFGISHGNPILELALEKRSAPAHGGDSSRSETRQSSGWQTRDQGPPCRFVSCFRLAPLLQLLTCQFLKDRPGNCKHQTKSIGSSCGFALLYL